MILVIHLVKVKYDKGNLSLSPPWLHSSFSQHYMEVFSFRLRSLYTRTNNPWYPPSERLGEHHSPSVKNQRREFSCPFR
jgi:hypothetical protein